MIEHLISSIEKKDFEKAIADCDTLIAKTPSNPMLYQIRATCNIGLGKDDEALKDLNYALEKSKGDDEIHIPEILHKRANIFLKNGNYSEAVLDLRKSLDYIPGDNDTKFRLSQSLKHLGRYDEALNYVDETINAQPGNSEAYNLKANILYSKGDISNSLLNYSKAIETDKSNAKPLFNRGLILYNNNDKISAANDFKEAIRLNPANYDELKPLIPDLDVLLNTTFDTFTDVKDDTVIEPILPEKDFSDNTIIEQPETENVNEEIEKISENISADNDEEIVIPQFDFDKIFNNQNIEDEKISSEIPEEPDLKDNVIDENVRNLHHEIESSVADNIEIPKVVTEIKDVPDLKNTERDENSAYMKNEIESSVADNTEPPKSYPMTNYDQNYYGKEKSSWHKILMYGIIVVIIGFGLIYGLNYLLTNIKSSSDVQTSSKDSVKQNASVTNETEKHNDEVKKEQESLSENTSGNTSEFLGHISEKKNFVIFKETDGFYIQMGSYKDKNFAEAKLNDFKKYNLPVKVYEVDLKEKGTYYRIRAGAYKSKEEAVNSTSQYE